MEYKKEINFIKYFFISLLMFCGTVAGIITISVIGFIGYLVYLVTAPYNLVEIFPEKTDKKYILIQYLNGLFDSSDDLKINIYDEHNTLLLRYGALDNRAGGFYYKIKQDTLFVVTYCNFKLLNNGRVKTKLVFNSLCGPKEIEDSLYKNGFKTFPYDLKKREDEYKYILHKKFNWK